MAMKRPDYGIWENEERMWPLRDDNVVYAMLTEGRSIFMLLMRTHWICENHETDISMTNFRRNLLKPMIRLGLDINMHARDLYKWYPRRISHMLNIIGELIRHGLSNFHSTTDASIPVILICYAASNGVRPNFCRRCRKVRQIVQLVHRFGASYQLYKSQLKFKESAPKKVQTRDIDDNLFNTLSYSLRWFQYQCNC